jgi:hypothetical protein
MRRPGRQTSLACETKSDGKRINALDAPLNSTPPRRPEGPRSPDEQNQKSSPAAHIRDAVRNRLLKSLVFPAS